MIAPILRFLELTLVMHGLNLLILVASSSFLILLELLSPFLCQHRSSLSFKFPTIAHVYLYSQNKSIIGNHELVSLCG